MSDASMTNIQMVRPKGPKVFLAVLGLGLAGGAAYYFTRPAGPVGEPEDPRKILVVTDVEDVAKGLGSVGFVAEQGSFDALAAEGAKQGASGAGIEAILHLADMRGFGYVALHDPKQRGITGLTVTADSAAIEDGDAWAVFSVGDLGKPPRVTKDPDRSVLPMPPYVQIIRAAFLQERLAGTLFAESQLPMNAIELHKAIEPAIELHAAYALLDRRVTKEERSRTESLLEAEQAPTKPAILAEPLEQSRVLPLGDGTVLSLVSGWHLESPWDADVKIEHDPEWQVWYHPADANAPRKRCESLRGGSLPPRGRFVLSPWRDSVLVDSGGVIEVWTLDTKAGGCAFSRAGTLPRPSEYEQDLGVLGPGAKAARGAIEGLAASLHLWSPGKEQPDRSIDLPGCTTLGAPVWLDEQHLAISCAFAPPVVDEYGYDDYEDDLDPEAEPLPAPPPPPPSQVWIYVVQAQGDRIVAIPGTALGDYVGPYTLHAVPSPGATALLAVRSWDDEVTLVRSDRDPAGLFTLAEPTFKAIEEADAALPPEPVPTAVPTPAVEPAPGTEPAPVPEPERPLLRPAFAPVGSSVAALAPEGLVVSAVKLGGVSSDIDVSPDGKRIVYVADRGRVSVTELDGSKTTTLSESSRADQDASRFTSDGRSVVFTSSYRGEDGGSTQVGRRATLP